MTILPKKNSKNLTLQEVTNLLNELRLPTALATTPVNLEEERVKFLASDSYNPFFKYKRLKNENHKVFSQLMKVESVVDVDPRISDFYIKLIDSKREVNDLINAIGDNLQFSKISVNRFKQPTPILFRNACRVLRNSVKDYNFVPEKKEKKVLNFEEAKKVIEKAYEEYGLTDWSVEKSANIARNGMKVGVKRQEILIDGNMAIPEKSLSKSIVHEMTHVIRSYNGTRSGFEALGKPTLPYYLDVEEGLATLNVENAGLLRYSDLKKQVSKVWAIYIGYDLSFRELFDAALAFETRQGAFDLVYRVKRGLGDCAMPGINAKDVVYFRGFRKVRRKYYEDKEFIKKLYAGKIGFSQVKWVDEGLIKRATLYPANL